MPTDVVQVNRDRWSLCDARIQFNSSQLFHGAWGSLSAADIIDGLDVEYDLKAGQPANIRRYPALPAPTRRLVAQFGCQHPGVALDKLAFRYADQNLSRATLHEVVQVNKHLGDESRQDTEHWFHQQFARWRRIIASAQASVMSFQAVTIGPLTLHLARASALENAGICLHPLYGFVYLPGTGLKGMARAYAETVADADAQQIKNVSGSTETAGQIVFHDAWPAAWPKLIVDILNNHHAKYYQGQGDDAPGDWENPVPVYFLAVEPGQTIEFAVAKRRSDVPDTLLDQAHQWLLGALCHLGAGPKTNVGYGAFQPVEGPRPALVSPRHATFEATLELVTPAFLAGANQQAEDCDLRPATLSGLLRWWWRTMHAGSVDVDTLRAMEAAIWGDTQRGGAVRITLEPIGKIDREPYDKRQLAMNNRLPRPTNKTTSQGLWYHSYGMDEKKLRRHFVAPGAQWQLSMSCSDWSHDERAERGRPTRDIDFSAQKLMDQVQASLWLLCHCGGVGAKCRKGFGSLADPFHLTRTTAGGLAFRATVFHPPRLWAKRYHDDQTGPRIAKDTLQKFLDHFRRDLAARVKRHPNSLPQQAGGRTAAPKAANQVGSAEVRVKVLGKNEKLNNAYFVREEGKARGELRFGRPPADQAPPEPGDVLQVYRHNNDARSPLYRWDPPPTQQGPRGPRGRGGPPRRRGSVGVHDSSCSPR